MQQRNRNAQNVRHRTDTIPRHELSAKAFNSCFLGKVCEKNHLARLDNCQKRKPKEKDTSRERPNNVSLFGVRKIWADYKQNKFL